jgi:phosphoketolase
MRCNYRPMGLSRHKDGRNLQRKVLEEAKGEHKTYTLGETSIKISINIHQTPLDGGAVAGAELTELEKQLKRKKRDIQFGAKSRMPEASRKRAPGRESGQYRS